MKIHSLRALIFLFFPLMLASCLKDDLPEMNSSSLNNVSDFNLLYKYSETVIDNPGTPKENTRTLIRTVKLNKVMTISNNTINVLPSLPSNFPVNEKAKVNLNNIVGYANIPVGATIKPVGQAPILGTIGSFLKPVTYEVTAANGDKKNWVINVAPLIVQ